MSDYDSLLASATELPLADRIQLIEALWTTIPEGAYPPLSEDWLAEIARRSAEFDAGLVAVVPWEQVKADALRRLERR